MLDVTVVKQSILGIDYIITTIFKDGKVVKCTHESIGDINVVRQTDIYTMLKTISEKKLNLLKTI